MNSKKFKKKLYKQIEPNLTLIDLGCGKGEHLKDLSEKISYGLGIDLNKRKIKKANKNKPNNIEFEKADSTTYKPNQNFDYALASALIHSLNYESQIKTLQNMQKYSRNQLILDYIKSQNLITKGLIYADEFLAGHFKKYKNSMEKGIGNIIEEAGLKIKNSKTIPWENKSPEPYDILNLWICE